ncbi:MAG: division/cell wall cluster transcriptional repressor MraZ [Terriglobia bacterium]
MLRGNAPAKVDEKGRVKIPSIFRAEIEQEFGSEFYVTSLRGDCVRLYPFPIWNEIEQKISSLPQSDPAIKLFLRNTNYYGQMTTMDSQGRILIPALLRDSAQVRNEVSVQGHLKYLEIWNAEILRRQLEEMPFSEEHEQTLSRLGI